MMRLLNFVLMMLSLLFILHCSKTKRDYQTETAVPQIDSTKDYQTETAVPQIDSAEIVTEDSLATGLGQSSED